MTREFGIEFAKQFATAHEGLADTSDAEAMDLYNNEVGRRIPMENPNASPQELADLVQDAVKNGEMVVIDKKANLLGAMK
nr:wnt family protein [Vandammella animalimorsus]